MNAPPPVISVQGLGTRFGKHWVHKNLDFQVQPGEIVGLVGGSGSGKTTLLKQMIGLLQPDEGSVRVFGSALFGQGRLAHRALRRRFGVLFQQGALFSAFTVFENIAFPLRELRLLDKDLIAELVYLKLAQVELNRHHGQLMPAELSGGMIKRVALARALALEPELLFLDEPTAGLDPDRSARFISLIRELRSRLGLTVVLVTHDLDTLEALATRVAVLADRRVIAEGPIEQVIDADHLFIGNFFEPLRRRRKASAQGA